MLSVVGLRFQGNGDGRRCDPLELTRAPSSSTPCSFTPRATSLIRTIRLNTKKLKDVSAAKSLSLPSPAGTPRSCELGDGVHGNSSVQGTVVAEAKSITGAAATAVMGRAGTASCRVTTLPGLEPAKDNKGYPGLGLKRKVKSARKTARAQLALASASSNMPRPSSEASTVKLRRRIRYRKSKSTGATEAEDTSVKDCKSSDPVKPLRVWQHSDGGGLPSGIDKAKLRVKAWKEKKLQMEKEKEKETVEKREKYSCTDLDLKRQSAGERAAAALKAFQEDKLSVEEQKRQEASNRRAHTLLVKAQRRAEVYAINAVMKERFEKVYKEYCHTRERAEGAAASAKDSGTQQTTVTEPGAQETATAEMTASPNLGA